MTIRAKFRGGNKVVIRYRNNLDELYLIHILVNARDRPGSHPKMSVKNISGEELPSPKPEKTAEQIIKENKAKLLAVKPPEVK